ncbi:MAG: UvrD-helicase domain-containing protein [Calditrichae bacterium]|nr:UvrD-helicase domain-containing protein [Calditrichia bacterium]
MDLTLSQQAALALDKNISVTAGAGSGKTRILVERFLKIVKDNPLLTRFVVAITFTEKAAGEMQERIADEVNNRLHNDTITAAERKTLQIIRDNLNSAHISTIHGFCMRILREFPIEAGVSPDFGILDAIRQQVLLSNTIRSIFKDLDETASLDTETDWLKLFLAIPRRRIAEMLEKALQKPFEMEKVVERFQSFTPQSYIEFLQERWLALFTHSVAQDDIEKAVMLTDEILNHDGVPFENKQPKGQELASIFKEFSNSFHSDPVSIETKSAYLKLAELITTSSDKAYAKLTHLGKKESWSIAAQDTILQLSDLLAPLKQKIKKMDPGSAPDNTDIQWFDIFNIFIKLYKKASLEFTHVKNELGLLDFEDLQIFTLHLLRSNEAVREKLQKRFRYIMVDEFQDTNAMQWEIVEKLATNNGKLSPDQVFVVGDPKQSIYGFRDADIRVFRDVINQFSTHAGSLFSETYDGNIIFRESFRFLPRINHFINHFFGRILQSSPHNPFEVGYEDLSAERQVPESGHIELTVLDEEKKQSEADFLAYRISNLMESKTEIWEWLDGKEQQVPLQYGDIAILIRDRGNLFDIEQSLRLHGIPFKTVGGIGFWQRQEIYDFYHILRFLANPADDLALTGILRSRFFMLSDTILYYLSRETELTYLQRLTGELKHPGYSIEDRAKIKDAAFLITKWLDARERMTLAELLNIIVEDTKLFTLLNAEFSGEQRTANLQKVIELADNFDQSGPGGLRAFLETIDDLINREVREGEAFLALDDRSSVKIMTIHVSKGLQFPVVFVPYLNKSMRSAGTDIMLDADLGMSVTFKDEDEYNGNRSNENTLYRLLKLRQKQKDLAELKRIFYVAVSRASNFLFLSAGCKQEKPSHDSMFELLVNPLINSGINPFEAGVHNFEKFELIIRDSFPETEKDNRSHETFSSFLKETEKSYISAPEMTDSSYEIAEALAYESTGRIFSATALMTFIKDPLEYFNRYHLGFFEGDYSRFSGTRKDSFSDSLKKGKIVHRFLELFQKQTHSPDDIIDQVLFEHEIFDSQSREEYKYELAVILKTVKSSETGKSILSAKNYQNEVSLTMMLGNDYFTGTIDRLQQANDNNWEIVDYKTNKISEKELQQTGREYDIQMQAYALLLSRLYPQQQSYKVTLYFLTIDKTYQKIFSKMDIQDIENYFRSVIEEIKKTYPVSLD